MFNNLKISDAWHCRYEIFSTNFKIEKINVFLSASSFIFYISTHKSVKTLIEKN